jgi:hypothetical protein
MIDHFETRLLAEIVDAGDIDQIIERKFAAAKLRDLTEITRRDRKSRFVPKFSLVLKFRAKDSL